MFLERGLDLQKCLVKIKMLRLPLIRSPSGVFAPTLSNTSISSASVSSSAVGRARAPAGSLDASDIDDMASGLLSIVHNAAHDVNTVLQVM